MRAIIPLQNWKFEPHFDRFLLLKGDFNCFLSFWSPEKEIRFLNFQTLQNNLRNFEISNFAKVSYSQTLSRTRKSIIFSIWFCYLGLKPQFTFRYTKYNCMNVWIASTSPFKTDGYPLQERFCNQAMSQFSPASCTRIVDHQCHWYISGYKSQANRSSWLLEAPWEFR